MPLERVHFSDRRFNGIALTTVWRIGGQSQGRSRGCYWEVMCSSSYPGLDQGGGSRDFKKWLDSRRSLKIQPTLLAVTLDEKDKERNYE